MIWYSSRSARMNGSGRSPDRQKDSAVVPSAKSFGIVRYFFDLSEVYGRYIISICSRRFGFVFYVYIFVPVQRLLKEDYLT